MTTHPPCRGLMGTLFGHLFEAQYSYGAAATYDSLKGSNADAVGRMLEATKARTYVLSVCRRCGAQAGSQP